MARLPGEKPFCCEIRGMQVKYLKLRSAVERLHVNPRALPSPALAGGPKAPGSLAGTQRSENSGPAAAQEGSTWIGMQPNERPNGASGNATTEALTADPVQTDWLSSNLKWRWSHPATNRIT